MRSLIITFFLLSFCYANKIAIATKVKGKAEISSVVNNKFSKLTVGTILSDGDRIRTAVKSFVAIIFIDDKSTLKLKEKSEIVVNGQRSAASIAKRINMDVGTIRATIKEQNTDFVIQTPTSVASVKGTDFWLISDIENGDELFGLEGIVSLLNSITGQEINVTEGMSGLSMPDGNLEIIQSDESSIPSDPTERDNTSSNIKIFLEGMNGEQKILIIQYQ